MYERILIATDGSKFANAALVHGIELARNLGSAVAIVTVTETWSAFQMAENIQKGKARPIEEFDTSSKEAAQKILDEARTVADTAGVNCDVIHVSNNFPAPGIINAAEKENCDLIIMASHGRRGLDRMLLGSQTSEVLEKSKIPVLVIR